MAFLVGLIVVAAAVTPLVVVRIRKDRLPEAAFRRRQRGAVAGLIAAVLFLIGFFVFVNLYTDYLWFRSLGFAQRFLRVLRFEVALYFSGFAAAFVFLFLIFRHAFGWVNGRLRRYGSLPLALGLSLLLGVWTSGLWPKVLLYLNQVRSEATEPIFLRSVSYYLFSLPLYSSLVGWLILLFVLALGVTGICLYALAARGPSPQGGVPGSAGASASDADRTAAGLKALSAQLMVLIALPLFALAWNAVLNIWRLMYSSWGVVFGPGYVDVNFRVLGFAVTAGALAVTGILLLIAAASPPLRRKLLGILRRREDGSLRLTARIFVLPAALIGTVVVFTSLVPGVVDALVVRPNEISLERPYLQHNIALTRRGFGLTEERIEERQYAVGRDISPRVIDQNESTLMNVRLWDPRALRDNLKQQQEIRLYYEFFDVDIDRYHLNGDYRQVMLSVRELEKSELDPASQTWVSRHFKYTHGYGLVLLPAHDFLPQGRPNLLVRGIPPEESIVSLEVKRPEIYYGERTRDHVYVRTSQREFDYPSGEKNVYASYGGAGGVPIDTAFKRFVFALRNDGFRLIFSTYINQESRIMFRREIRRRVASLAPFLRYDRDPYAVVTDAGRVKYVIDAYTASADYPYSERYAGRLRQFAGLNYLRNSVKAVVDAYDGSVSFYIVDPDDVLIQTYRRIFPELFESFEDMPADLRRHIRYPEDFLTVQAEMYSTYHMTDVDVFYQREDVWEFATERYRESFQAVEPYYVMLNFPDEEDIEFVLIIPFTPRNKNVINAWMAGRCDAPNYGKIVVYSLPKGVEMLGPRQIEARIDQDTEMSRALSLWGQRGSEVIRGNLLAIPLFTPEELYLLYVEPIFLQAENAQLPEIKRVAMADSERVVWAEEFDAALELLAGEAERRLAAAQVAAAGQPTAAGPEGTAPPAAPEAVQSTLQRALDAFRGYKDALAREDFAAAGRRLEEVNRLLGELSDRLGRE